MQNTVTISRNEYVQLLMKECAYDSVCQQLESTVLERDKYKSLWDASQAVLAEVTGFVLKLESDLKAEGNKNLDLEGEIKNLSDQVAKYKDMLFGNKGNKKGKKKDEGPAQETSACGDQELKASRANLIQLTEAANRDREKQKQDKKEAEPKKGNEEENLPREENVGNIPVRDKHIYPLGYDPELHEVIGKKIKYVLRVIPAKFYWERIIRYACKDRPDCKDKSDNANGEPRVPAPTSQFGDDEPTKIYEAPKVPLPFPKSHVGADFIAWVIMLKFMFSMPEFRIQRMLQLTGFHGMCISKLNYWVKRAAEKLYILYLQQKAFVLESDYVQADEVHYPIADRKGEPTRKGASFQVYDASEKRRGCFFYYEAGSRSSDVAKYLLKDFIGTVQVDAYAGYLWLHKKEGVTVMACLVHIMRRFRDSVDLYHEEEARPFYNAILAMYGVDHTLQEEGANYETIRETRLKKTLPIFNSLVDHAKKMVTRVRPKSGFGRALKYFLDNAEGIRNVFNDGRYYFDNNPVERRNRTTTIGRKNYLFAKNNDTAENLAIFYTFTETLMELGSNAFEYLEHVLNLPLDNMKPEELRKELPYFYAQRRKKAEAAKVPVSNPT